MTGQSEPRNGRRTTLVALVRAGARFENGKLIERPRRPTRPRVRRSRPRRLARRSAGLDHSSVWTSGRPRAAKQSPRGDDNTKRHIVFLYALAQLRSPMLDAWHYATKPHLVVQRSRLGTFGGMNAIFSSSPGAQQTLTRHLGMPPRTRRSGHTLPAQISTRNIQGRTGETERDAAVHLILARGRKPSRVFRTFRGFRAYLPTVGGASSVLCHRFGSPR
jgi:hypothetical protein